MRLSNKQTSGYYRGRTYMEPGGTGVCITNRGSDKYTCTLYGWKYHGVVSTRSLLSVMCCPLVCFAGRTFNSIPAVKRHLGLAVPVRTGERVLLDEGCRNHPRGVCMRLPP